MWQQPVRLPKARMAISFRMSLDIEVFLKKEMALGEGEQPDRGAKVELISGVLKGQVGEPADGIVMLFRGRNANRSSGDLRGMWGRASNRRMRPLVGVVL